MDLYAYQQIEDYNETLQKYNISVPRLRGIRKMSEENIFTEEDIQNRFENIFKYFVDTYFKNKIIDQTYCICYYHHHSQKEFSHAKHRLKKILAKNGLNWNMIHGKERKRIKYLKKKTYRDVKNQLEMFNKYAGKDKIYMIHSRIGDQAYWSEYNAEYILDQSWYLDYAVDYFDSTYCDIYVSIGGLENEKKIS